MGKRNAEMRKCANAEIEEKRGRNAEMRECGSAEIKKERERNARVRELEEVRKKCGSSGVREFGS